MNIVIDTNVLFSALIKDSYTRKIILEYEFYLLFPEYIFVEFKRYKKEVIKKSGLSLEEFDTLFNLLLKNVIIVPNSRINLFKKEAVEIAKGIDLDDAVFFATALAFNAVIWSDDKDLKKQDKVKVYNSFEIGDFL